MVIKGCKRIVPVMAFLAALSAGCTARTPEPNRIGGDLVIGPETTSRDASFQSAIANAEGRSALSLLERLNEFDNRPAPRAKGEFETTAAYATRLKSENSRGSYGRKCYAYVSEGDFSYDADSQSASFFTPLKHGFPPSPDSTHAFENVTIDDDVSEGTPLVANVPIEHAQRLTHGELRIARVFTLAGQSIPAVSGWSDPDPFDDLSAVRLVNDEPRYDAAYSRVRRQSFVIRARLINVRVFDPKQGGLEAPLFSWGGASDSC